jgi:galactokinase
LPSHVTAFAPGRVNLIGEHTDYNGGLALPFAIAEGITVDAVRLSEPRIEARALDLDEEDGFPLDSPPGASGWRAFVRGAVGELGGLGVKLPGARLEIRGTVPRGAGLSSSAAMEVAIVLALIALGGAPEPDRVELAKLCSRIENDWVGARTGLLDQLASLFGERERALRIDFSSLDVMPVTLALGEFSLVTLDSGESHDLSDSGYNERRDECARACSLLGVASLSEATREQAVTLPEPLAARARHVITENTRVEGAVEALERGELAALGPLLDASHASLRDCYQVSTPAVEAAVARLHDAGALGARIVGGGFGGSVLALMGPGAAAPEAAVVVEPGPGAHVRPVDVG